MPTPAPEGPEPGPAAPAGPAAPPGPGAPGGPPVAGPVRTGAPPGYPPPGYAPPPGPPSLARRLAPPLGTLAAVAGAFAYVGAVDPNEPGHYPVCPLLRFTGLYCPGCGGLRSAHAFVHGDLAAAFGANALAVTGYLVFAVVMVLWLVRAVRALPVRVTVGPVWGWVLGAVPAFFAIVRNLPFGSALAP
ncbi:DUF2752 domain-containing protein [Streptomyces sp. NPDC051310]|uniref:DUF2752 domain-containing protein n=1 Tax=Streptomyces sp. NPDC051310 TaxID=3365649 RepID=UPI0037B1179F